MSESSRHTPRPSGPIDRSPAWVPPADLAPIPPTDAFLGACEAFGIVFDPGDVERLGRLLALMLSANETMNLTSIRAPADAWMRHVFDSLTLLPLIAEAGEAPTIIDVGSGGGFPGLPIAVVAPNVTVTLLDATAKKMAYIRATADALGLRNVVTITDRAERAAHDRGERTPQGRVGGKRDSFDVAMCRALGPLPSSTELVLPFVKPGGIALFIKGERADDELVDAAEALKQLGGQYETTVTTPTGRIVVISKVSTTPKTYPRPDGEPKRAPIGSRQGKFPREGSSTPAALPKKRTKANEGE